MKNQKLIVRLVAVIVVGFLVGTAIALFFVPKNDAHLIEGNLLKYPIANLSISLEFATLDDEVVVGYYHVKNNSLFFMPIELYIFYGDLDKYHSRNLFENFTSLIPIGENEILPIAVRHGLTAQEYSEITEVRQHIILENQTGSKFRISGRILKNSGDENA